MRQNEFVAVSTDKVLLVPYDRRHVLTYHGWMEDPAIQEATASERLTLEEEYENQESWRASHDKMTFIVCQPLPSLSSITNGSHSEPMLDPKTGRETIQAGIVDTPDKMVGDINLFLSPCEDDEEEEQHPPRNNTGVITKQFVGEVDIMIANAQNQGRGIGKAAVLAFLGYIGRHLGEILREYYYQDQTDQESRLETKQQTVVKLELHSLVAKINQTNERSIALFKSLGFEQEGDGPNFFGEVKLVLPFAKFTTGFSNYSISQAPPWYKELGYVRAGEEGQS
ncbi:GNAT domain-containing protein [Rhypophila decipiens]|uniref:GNAT domain-containing protein n=1 Tax=Rhypophila decipiens TaxID=261697 RepID=A0AAN6YD29_9PEZI|nr:GNAT domain-containing protein [Rhypophila decipiens]